MDASGEEVQMWKNVLSHPNDWIVETLSLRIDMSSQATNEVLASSQASTDRLSVGSPHR